MAKYGSNSIVIEIDEPAGGSLVNITQFILTINGVEVEALIEESHSFGDAWFEALATGVRRMNDIVLTGFFDDVASGPNVIFSDVASGPAATTRTFKVTWGGTKTTTVEVLIQKYTRQAVRNEITKFEATLKPTGTVTEV